jgi:uncharacterized protein (TIGR03084 family)
MPPSFGEIVDDLAAEHAALAPALGQLTAEEWERPTHAPGWSVRDQVAHLAMFDDLAELGLRDDAAFEARVSAGALDGYMEAARERSHDDLLGWWQGASSALIATARTAEAKKRCPWFGVEMGAVSYATARLMETWSHGLDVIDVVAPERVDGDSLRHICHLGTRTRSYSYQAHDRPMPAVEIYVSLTLPSGAQWSDGDPGNGQRVEGSAVDFCRLVTQRRHIADTDLVVTDGAAEEWMSIAQAFAGPPGEGREPGQFPKGG